MSLHSLPEHSLPELRRQRLARSTRPFKARGSSVKRCQHCMLKEEHCICQWRRPLNSKAKFCLIMHDLEPLKPTNTGRLIADILPDTQAFIWSRTNTDPDLLKLVQNPDYAPYLIFPAEYVAPERVTVEVKASPGKIPLFLLLDATWQQARKMCRQSPWLAEIPVLALQPQVQSRYQLRKAYGEQHLCTAEVAIELLKLNREPIAAGTLNAWFEIFTERYQAGRLCRPVSSDSDAYRWLENLNKT